jgi:hypothetical protein
MSNAAPPATPPQLAQPIPDIILQEATAAAAAAAQEDEEAVGHDEPKTSNASPDGHVRHHGGVSPHLETVPPPAYSSANYGELDIQHQYQPG